MDVKKETNKVRFSPFSKEYWLDKINPDTGLCYTIEEADFKRRSLRKNDKCYWLLQINPETGIKYSEEEAIIKATEFHKMISIKGALRIKELGPDLYPPEKRTNRIEYYLAKGLSIEEAQKALFERQSTFSKEKCIKRYGDKGEEIWKTRQDKWQKTLKEKSLNEIIEMNKKKALDYKFFSKDVSKEEKQKIIEKAKEKGWRIFDTEEELISFIKTDYTASNSNYYKKAFDYLKSFPKITFAIFNKTAKYYLKFIKDDERTFDTVKSPRGFYTKKTEYGLLRSGLEIAMYNIINELGLTLDGLDKFYPNSTLRYDFKINGVYIEICGMMTDKKYRANMLYKRNTFNSVLVLSTDNFKKFLIDYFINKDDERINYYNSRPL